MITSSLRAEKFEVVKERYAMETRKIVRGIILAVLLVCAVFLIYSIANMILCLPLLLPLDLLH